jgi:hypothetical protein
MTRLKKNSLRKLNEDYGFKPSSRTYAKFKKINGKHPFQKATKDSFVAYRARVRHGGKVVVFNYELAREMGLLPSGHPDKMTKDLEKAILDTFAIVIINEYDQINKIKYPEKDIKPNFYMATRYLQLQHPNKQGKTSGDGRSVWNGCLETKNGIWDLSSCGTGATCLSPATHIQNKYFQTGDPSISYGCGYAELDEGLATMFFSEILNKNQVTTERVLGVLQFPDGYAITIRVHNNLLRPSHMFNHLKQSSFEALQKVVDYYIDRQIRNGVWTDMPDDPHARYDKFLEKQTAVFAKTAAKFEDEYIFCWLDWDGDNVLMDGGIIDYGSVRQFGLFHSEYRFDDQDRFSTSILEQKSKAKYTVQNFAQIVSYLKTGERRSLKEFCNEPWSEDFERIFENCKLKNLLYRLGFKKEVRQQILGRDSELVQEFLKSFSYFERAKSVKGPKKVNDGINWDAIFCMRDILRELPQLYLSRGESLKRKEFLEILKSTYATKEDLTLTSYRKKKIDSFQDLYWQLVKTAASLQKITQNKVLLNLTMRSSVINKYDRVTGDSITTITDMMMEKVDKMSPDRLYGLLQNFSEYQNLDPDTDKNLDKNQWQKSQLMRGFLQIVRDYREGL